jgi:hypothetical protein
MPPNQHPIYMIKTKDFIPSGPIDWFKNSIPAPDSFEEGNMANISPIPLSLNIALTPGLTLHQFAKNNDHYTHEKQ